MGGAARCSGDPGKARKRLGGWVGARSGRGDHVIVLAGPGDGSAVVNRKKRSLS